MQFALLAALVQAATAVASPVLSPPTVPTVAITIDGRTSTLPSRVLSRDADSVTVGYGRPVAAIPMIAADGTGGVLPMTVPTIAYDQPFALRNARTGEITTYPGIVERRTPTVVVVKSASAVDAYQVDEAPEPAVGGSCSPRKS
jgi:hypothetical protein